MTTVDDPPVAVSRRAMLGWLGVHRSAFLVTGAAAALYAVLALLQPIPLVTPDEFTYRHLAGSLAHGHGMTWRGTTESFRSALYIYLLLPFWAIGSTTAAYALSKVAGAVAVALVALPTWALARRLIGDPRVALIPVVLVAVGTWMTTAATLATENLALPFSAASLTCCALALLDRDGNAASLAVLFGAAAGWARAQVLLVPLIVVLALLADVVLATDRRGRLADFRVAMSLSAAGLALVALRLALGGDVLGAYHAATELRPSLGDALRATGQQLVTFAVMTGIVPTVLVVAGAGRLRQQDRDLRIVTLLCVVVLAAFSAQSGWYIAGSDLNWSIQRYIEYPVPLVLVLGTAFVARGALVAVSIGVAGVVVAVGLAFGHGVRRVIEERALYGLQTVIGHSHVALAVCTLTLTAFVAIAVRRLEPGRAAPIVGLIAAVVLLAQAGLGWRWQIDIARQFAAQFPSRTWVDDHGSGSVARIFVFANEPLFETGEFFSENVVTVLTPPSPFRGRGLKGGTCQWQLDETGALNTDGNCLSGVKRIWNDDPVVRMSFYGGRTLATDHQLGQMISIPDAARARVRSLLVEPCDTPTLRISRTGADFAMPSEVSCGGFTQVTLFLDSPGRLHLTFRGGDRRHRVSIGGRSWLLPAGRETTVSVPVDIGATKTTFTTDWRTSRGAPSLVAADVQSDGNRASLL